LAFAPLLLLVVAVAAGVSGVNANAVTWLYIGCALVLNSGLAFADWSRLANTVRSA